MLGDFISGRSYIKCLQLTRICLESLMLSNDYFHADYTAEVMCNHISIKLDYVKWICCFNNVILNDISVLHKTAQTL